MTTQYKISFTSPQGNKPSVKEQFESTNELNQFLRGLYLGGGRNIKQDAGKPVWYRLRCFESSRCLSSQVFSTIEQAKVVGNEWLHAQSNKPRTIAFSETLHPRC